MPFGADDVSRKLSKLTPRKLVLLRKNAPQRCALKFAIVSPLNGSSYGPTDLRKHYTETHLCATEPIYRLNDQITSNLDVRLRLLGTQRCLDKLSTFRLEASLRLRVSLSLSLAEVLRQNK